MAKIITFINNKGGVGKTTSVLNLGVALSKLDKKVLLVDMDAQANLTDILEAHHYLTINDLLIGYNDVGHVKEAVIKDVKPNIDAIASNSQLMGTIETLTNAISRETRLKRILKHIKNDYDFILIDCPPSLNLLVINSLTASNEAIIPISTDYHAFTGTKMIINIIEEVKELLNEDLNFKGVFITKYDERTNNDKEIKEAIQNTFKDKCFNTIIRNNIKIKDATNNHKSVIEYDEKSNGAIDYMALAKELIEKE